MTNVRSEVSSGRWDSIRKSIYARAGNLCEICGGRGPRHPVEAHEIFEYDENSDVQTLASIVALCPACHEVKHIGLAEVRGRVVAAKKHLATVNGWSAARANEYVAESFGTWERRSGRNWTLDLSKLSEYGVPADEMAAIISKRSKR